MNGNSGKSFANLIDQLEVGRYLIETRMGSNCIYLLILSTNTRILVADQSQPIANYNIVCLKLTQMESYTRKVMFKEIDKAEAKKTLQNDINMGNFCVSSEYFNCLLKMFKDSRTNNNIREQKENFEIVLIK